MDKEEIKNILQQYVSLKQEKEDKENSLAKIERRIEKIEEKGYKERDVVSGGEGGNQHFTVEGFPYPYYRELNRILKIRKDRLQQIEEKIELQLAAVEQYINSVEDSRMRRMLTYRYIDGMSWIEIAHKMGGGNTEDSCRKAVERFLR